MSKVHFKIGDWVKTGKERPFQIEDQKTAELCELVGYLNSSKEEQEEYDKKHKSKRYAFTK